MLDRFEEFDIATTGTTIHGRRGGQGPPVLLLHGIPETHLLWRQVAPQLAGQFTRGLQGGALFRTAIYHSHSVEEILDRISEYFETISAGRHYFGERKPSEVIEAPMLDSCEVASASL